VPVFTKRKIRPYVAAATATDSAFDPGNVRDVLSIEAVSMAQQARIGPGPLDATMRLFDPDIQPDKVRPRQQRARSACSRLGYTCG
jgi:hypothetical protein